MRLLRRFAVLPAAPSSGKPTRRPPLQARVEVVLALLLFHFFLPVPAADMRVADARTDAPIYHLASVPSDATNGLGSWIWADKTVDRQTCRLWKEFDIPRGAKVASARMKLTVDDGYQFFLDGRELGQGANWRGLTEYDLTLLLTPGHHVLAVNCFNDLFLAGLIMNLSVQFEDGTVLGIQSDASWRVVPENEKNWERLKRAGAGWPAATVYPASNRVRYLSRGGWPEDYMSVPRIQPLVVPFWQTGGFQLALVSGCGAALVVCAVLLFQLALKSKEERLLNQERARIARDIHDDFGTRLTRLILEGEVAQRELAANAAAGPRLTRINDGLRDALATMDEVLWAVNPQCDTVRDFVTYICEYAQTYLQPAGMQCLLEVEPDMPPLDFDLPLRRSLLLAVKEALANAARHSGAETVILRIALKEGGLSVSVEDNGKGFDPEQCSSAGNGLGNMAHRMKEVGGDCRIVSAPGAGCRIEFGIPLTRRTPRFAGWLRRFRRKPTAEAHQAPQHDAGQNLLNP